MAGTPTDLQLAVMIPFTPPSESTFVPASASRTLADLTRKQHELELALDVAMNAPLARQQGSADSVKVLELQQALSHARAAATWTEERLVSDLAASEATRAASVSARRWRHVKKSGSAITLLVTLALSGFASVACSRNGAVTFEQPGQPLTVRRPALYPETIEYNSTNGKFLLSSFREGAIYEVDRHGAVTQLVDDQRLCSVLGIAVDARRDKLWAVNADLGASVKPSTLGPKNLAAVGTYSLSTGKALNYVDLAPLSPGAHLLNGIALDSAGNAYVTDSFSPSIYKIDARGTATVLLQSDQFSGPGVNLNGLVVHPDGYLLVIKKSDGTLFRVPLADPSRFSKVSVQKRFIGGDGLLLVGKRDLVIIANQTPGVSANAAFSISSSDDWNTAEVRAVQQLGDVYPTTAVLRDGKIYVVHTKLNELLQSPPGQKQHLHLQATIQEIAKVRL